MDHGRPLHVPPTAAALPDDALVGELRALLAGVAAGDEAGGAEDAAGSTEFARLAERMALLADPRRLQILFCLHAHPGVRSSDLARAIQAHDSTTSHALALLREAGWVRALRTGREVRYELADALAHEILHALGSGHLPGVDHPSDHPHDHAHDPPGDGPGDRGQPAGGR